MNDSRSRPVARSAQAPGEVRIIGGTLRRSKLPVLSIAGLRPSPDRVRETLFNWLGQDLSGWHCLDAFAGTGVLGFECASRGAASTRLVEQHPGLVDNLRKQALRLKLSDCTQVHRSDGLAAISQHAGNLDLVLLDPPFDAPWAAKSLAMAAQAVKPNGVVYWESRTAFAEIDALALGLSVIRHMAAGQVHAHLLQRMG